MARRDRGSGGTFVKVVVSTGGFPLLAGVGGEYEDVLEHWAARELAIFQVANWDGPIWSTYSKAVVTGGVGEPTVALLQEILHQRDSASGTSVIVISRRRDDLERRATLSNLAIQIVKRSSADVHAPMSTRPGPEHRSALSV
ncbi:MAG: hypothetical protein ACLPVY_11245 [Acidimicrobiia bacterium]